MTNKISTGSSKTAWRPRVSFWITLTLWILLLIPFLVVGAFAAWVIMFALFLILTALYSLLFGRPSWLGLPHRKGAGGAIAGGVAALVAGALMVPAAPIDANAVQPLADVQAPVSSSATPSGSPTPSASPTPSPRPTPSASPTPQYVLLDACAVDGKSVIEGTANYVCTLDDKGVLVWMTEKDSKALLAGRVETKKVADQKVAADKASAEKAAADQAVADQAAAAEAARVAADQATAAEAARVAAEQAAAAEAARIAAQQAAQPQAPAPATYYANCTAAKAAGAAPLYVGQPGYRGALDRDKDGVACEN